MSGHHRPAVAVLLIDAAHAIRRIEHDRQVTLNLTPRICYRVLLDVLAKRERNGMYVDGPAAREAYAELVPPGTT